MESKLGISRETLRVLDDESLELVVGGAHEGGGSGSKKKKKRKKRKR